MEGSFWNELLKSNAIQLLCMLVCIAIVVCIFIRSYSRGKDIDNSDRRIQKLHLFYVSGILTFIIIELITGLCMGRGNDDQILNFVNFAATLSSLILSVVAIIFTIVYSRNGEAHYQKIDRASDNIGSSLRDFQAKTDLLKESLQSFSDQTNHLDSVVESFVSTSQNLNDSLTEISGKLDKIDLKTDKTIEVTSAIMFESFKAEKKEKPEVESETIYKVRFVKRASFAGALLMYACALSKKKSKPFSLKDISGDSDNVKYYYYAYIIASQGAGLITFKTDDSNCFEIIEVLEGLEDIAHKRVDEKLSKMKNNETSKQMLKNIEDFFAC